MSLAEYATQYGLHRVGARPKLWHYLKQTWDRRDFAVAMARFRIQAAQETNRLGMVWLVLQPTLNALIYGLIFYFLQTAVTGRPTTRRTS